MYTYLVQLSRITTVSHYIIIRYRRNTRALQKALYPVCPLYIFLKNNISKFSFIFVVLQERLKRIKLPIKTLKVIPNFNKVSYIAFV